MRLISNRSAVHVAVSGLYLLSLGAPGCAKKEPKPIRTEPWLAHPAASTSGSGDAALPLTRYALGEGSVVRFELPSKRGALSGSLRRVSGELNLDLSNLSQSRGSVRVELGSLEIHSQGGAEDSDSSLVERARAALGLTAAQASNSIASFDLTSVEDAVPPRLEPSPERDTGTPVDFNRRAQFTAVGDLLLHGFRVVRRAPLSAEFHFTGDRRVPHSVLIRSRAPFVISLETHAILPLAPEGRTKVPGSASTGSRDAHVSVELYGTKID